MKAIIVLFYLLLSLVMGMAALNPKRATALLKKVYGVMGINLAFSPKGERIVQVLSFLLMVLLLGAALFLAVLEV